MGKSFDANSAEMLFIRFLAARKYRKTPERFAIFHKALEMSSHFEVDTLHRALEEDGYHVSRATVYNTIQLLLEAGVVRRNVFGASAKYELRRDSHVHLVCKICGSIRELDGGMISASIREMTSGVFSPEVYSITVTGICADCSRKSNAENNQT